MRVGLPLARSSRKGGTVPAASRPIRIQGSLQLKMDKAIPSDSSFQENEKRRTLACSVPTAVRKNSSDSQGSIGALR